jgi:formylglycine-generating enzyme
MKSAKWILIVTALFACISAKNIHHGSIAIAQEPVTITKEQDFELDFMSTVYEEKLFSSPAEYPPAPCPDEMVEVTGDYCPIVKETCLKWIDEDKDNPMMCAQFAYPTRCVAKPIHMSFCIDKYEAQDDRGDVPEVFIDWYTAKDKCESSGKRLCDVRELTLACEGPERKPYPYGYKRDITKCNMGHQWIDPDHTPFSKMDRRAPSGAFETCKSDFGVYDIVGNVDEWSINRDGLLTKAPFESALFGGHYVNGVRNRCRDKWVPSITVSHGPGSKNYEISYRCCANTK